MRSVLCLFAIFCAANAFHFYENEHDHPVKEVQGDQGTNDHDRVKYIRAVIEPHHVRDAARVDFPRTQQILNYFAAAAAEGDEKGHLVASQFRGPPVWWNLSPQNPRVNRNAGYQSLNVDWFDTECKVAEYLQKGGTRSVKWEVHLDYPGRSNRPSKYRLRATFYDGTKKGDEIATDIANPFLNQDSENWICRACRTRKHQVDDCVRARA